jgi:ATP synthase protein I
VAKPVLNIIRNVAFSYVYGQIIVIAAITAFLYLLGGHNVIAFSFMWGGLICIIPNLYFAHKLFGRTGAQATRQIITSFYFSEVVKFILTILLFFVAFKYFNTNKLAIFIGYIVAQITFWISALFRHQTVNKHES